MPSVSHCVVHSLLSAKYAEEELDALLNTPVTRNALWEYYFVVIVVVVVVFIGLKTSSRSSLLWWKRPDIYYIILFSLRPLMASGYSVRIIGLEVITRGLWSIKKTGLISVRVGDRWIYRGPGAMAEMISVYCWPTRKTHICRRKTHTKKKNNTP